MTRRAPRDTALTCPAACGYQTPRPTTRGLAEYGLRLHDCARHRARAETRLRGQQRLAAIDRTPRPCTHARANHQHGTNAAYHLDSCRCDPCRVAAVAYDRRRTRGTAYGRWQPYVDAEPARQHVRELMSAGMGLKRIISKTGVSSGAMTKLVYGIQGRPPSRQIRPATAAAILAVTVELADGARVPAEPTWLLIRGLIALGYPKSWIAVQLGQQGPGLQLKTTTVTKAHADTIQRLADRYGATRGPSERARRYAAERGWTPDLLWQLDDADAAPPTQERSCGITAAVDDIAVARAYSGEPVPLNRPERLEVVARLHRAGHGYREISSRLHIAQRQVHRDLTDLNLITHTSAVSA